LSKQGKHGEAIPCYREAVRLKPDYFVAYFNFCISSHLAGDATATIQTFEQAVKNCGDEGPACEGGFYLAMAHQLVGDKGEARMWYDKTVERMEQKKPQRDNLRALRAMTAAKLG